MNRTGIKNFISLIRLSISGGEQDFTQGSIRRAVFLLAIPMILELCMESIFAVVDMFFVGKLGENAIATVGLTEAVITLIYSLAIGLSTAATAIVARRTGEKNETAASHAGMQVMMLSLYTSIVLGIIGCVFAGDILRLMGASEAVVSDGTIFARIMMAGSPCIIFLFVINGIFRGAGDAAMAMKSLWLGSIVNIILCPLMIGWLGLKGAAVATVIGRSSGVIYQLWHLFRGTGMLKMQRSSARLDRDVMKNIVSIAWPAAFQFIIASGSWIVLARLVAETGGTTASAGYQVAIRNVVFFILPAWGLSNAAATLVGQNLGAGQPDRAEKSVYLTARYNAIFMACVTLLFVLLAEPIIGIFTNDPLVAGYGANALRTIGCGYIFYGIGMVMTQALNGAGDTRTPTIINFCCFWLFQIPLAYILTKVFGTGTIGIFIAVPIAETAIALTALWWFRRGKWKTIVV